MSEERIGFIGLGNMGKPMAGHIAAAGHAVIAHHYCPVNGSLAGGN